MMKKCRAMNHDPDVYGADADEFNPSRHLDSEGKAPPDTRDESHGKVFRLNDLKNRHVSIVQIRSSNLPWQVRPSSLCSAFTFFARHMANNSLFIDIATILWALTVEPAKDEKGRDIIPDVEGSVNTSVVV